jgi:glutamine synthetase
MDAIDGLKQKIKPGNPLDKDIYDLETEKDHEFLLQDGPTTSAGSA